MPCVRIRSPAGWADISPAVAVASFLGTGLLPKAPGTWGSAAAALVGGLLLWSGGAPLLAAGALAAFGAGLWAIPRAGGEADPGWVVIDEVAGMWLALLPARLGVIPIVAAFALFRLFDIAKPGPVGRLDRVPGRWGIMGDDVAAGALAAACLWVGQRVLG